MRRPAPSDRVRPPTRRPTGQIQRHIAPVSDFLLDPRLEADTLPVGDLALSRVLLMDDARFPWLILVPRQPGLAELIDLPEAQRLVLTQEIDRAARFLKELTGAHKLNVAALGNMVRQLHVHVIARFETDDAWPSPVWGRGERRPYGAGDGAAMVARLRAGFGF